MRVYNSEAARVCAVHASAMATVCMRHASAMVAACTRPAAAKRSPGWQPQSAPLAGSHTAMALLDQGLTVLTGYYHYHYHYRGWLHWLAAAKQ